MIEIVIENIDRIGMSASKFIQNMGDKKVFAFEGTMGVGKTTFIKAICEKLGVKDVINSPSFSIINEYRSCTYSQLIYHFDFYRINHLKEALDIGTEEYLDSGNICFIEWPEIIKQLLPEETVFVRMNLLPNNVRKVVIC